MLTQDDIALILATRRGEVVTNRQSPIVLIYRDGGAVDPITGEIIEPNDAQLPTLSVVTEIASQRMIDRYLDNGIDVQKGDIWFSVDIDVVVSVLEDLYQVVYDGIHYEILSRDKKGLGAINRVEFVGRRLS